MINKFFERMITLLAVSFLVFAVVFTLKVKAENRPVDRPVLPEALAGYEVENGWEWFPSQPHVLHFVGPIKGTEKGVDHQEKVLKKFLDRHPEIAIVTLHSGGGVVAMGARMARVIHERELFTYVPKDASCSSACGFMWLAGKKRILDGKLGAHAVSLGHAGDTPTTNAVAYAEVQQFLGNLMGWMYEYDVPVYYYARMLLTPSTTMYYFSGEELDLLVTAQDTPRFDHIDNFVALKWNYLRALQEWREYERERQTAD